MLNDTDLLDSLRLKEVVSLVAARWALVCKSKLVQGFNLDGLIEFLKIVDAVADIEKARPTSTVPPDIRSNHASLLHHTIAMLMEPMAKVGELSLGQQGELTTAIDQMAHSVAAHLIGINPSSAFWTRVLQ